MEVPHPPHPAAGPGEGPAQEPARVRIIDKRRAGPDEAPKHDAPGPLADLKDAPPAAGEDPGAEAAGSDPGMRYLDDLMRLQAEFDNYRKRMAREQAALGHRAGARLIEALLPVVDDFERAIAHGEGGEGLQLVFKQLRETLGREGLEEVPAEGLPFDPNVHEAVSAVDDPSVEEPVCREVFRRGYTLKGQILRPAMVVVAHPVASGIGSEDA